MHPRFQLFPDQASTYAEQVDPLTLFITAVTVVMTLLITALVTFFAIKYRRRAPDERPHPTIESGVLEAAWTLIPFVIVMVIFFWGTRVYFMGVKEVPGALDIHVIGKQWMWKTQHPNGRREINQLHVPVGRDVQLTIASQDVIHSFFVPAFRLKHDAVPGRYTKLSFKATKTGEFHLFCAEYCGTDHSGMVGSVFVMEPDAYEAWLSGTSDDEPPAEAGAKLFKSFGCATCHGVQAPTLAGLFGTRREVILPSGRRETVTADEQYIRESILNSGAKMVPDYQPIMPSFRGQVSEDQLMQLVAYVKSLRNAKGPAAGATPTTSGTGDRVPDKTPSNPGPANQLPND